MAESTGFTRRHFLTVATVVTGGAGVIATAVPFVSSFKPSARAQALGAPIEVDVSKLELGALLKVEWRGHPIYILHRTDEMLASLKQGHRAATRSDVQGFRAAALRDQRAPQHPARVSRARGRLHALGLRADAALRGRARGSRVRNGRAASCARAMARSSTSRAASSRACPRRRTSVCRRIATSTTARS